MFKCINCDIKFKSYKGLQNHNSKSHKISGVDTYVSFYHHGIWPVCKCGCKKPLNFQGGKFGEYIRGHKAKVSGGFYSIEGSKKSAKTRKDKFASGELVQWNKGIPKTDDQMKSCIIAAKKYERRKLISDSLSGKPKSDEHVLKIQCAWKTYWGMQENRDAQRLRRCNYMNNSLIKNPTKLEKEFQTILNTLNISYIFQYTVKGYNYDFYIPSKNTLIEVDGDWWHCNTNLNIQPIYESQKNTIEHDLIKNKIALENGYNLLRFWEHDIKTQRSTVICKLLKIIV